MDLNRMGAGKKLVDEIIKQGNSSKMGWNKTQQEKRDSRKNPHTPTNKTS